MRWPEDFEIKVNHKVYDEISKFYYNISLKYLHNPLNITIFAVR